MESTVSSGTVFQFGWFEADAACHTLTRKGVRVKIQDKPFQALILLVEKRGEIVSREELHRALWPEGTYVDFDGGLNVVLKKLRAAIEDESENPRFVETIPRHGYRFIAPVSVIRHEAVAQTPEWQGKTTPRASTDGISLAAQHKIKPRIMLALAALALLLAGMGWRYFLRNQSVVHAAPKVIAVLPFSNEGAGPDFDYLRYAIGNDLVTDLSYARSITVRPFGSTAKYGEQSQDPVAAGKELHATHVLSGDFRRDQQNLRINLELVEVAQGKSIWRDEVTVAPQELIGLHQKLAASATQRLLPAMNISGASTDEIPAPKNQRAFDLFLHSAADQLDPGPNQTAIQSLEQSLALDSGYAPAWHQLAWRYYIDYQYGNGGKAARTKSLAARKRVLELDPNAQPWVSLRVEQGDLDGAYDEVSDFLRRHPDSDMHFAMSYVLRYAGLLDESRKECEEAFASDPVNGYRSCATSFILAGDYAGAQKYINLDRSSGFAALLRMDLALRTGNRDVALAEANTAVQLGYNNVAAKLVGVCLSHPSQTVLVKAVADLEADRVSSNDPEFLYQDADALSFCGGPDAALRQLRKAIEGSYCSYPAMKNDPLFNPIRQRTEFGELQQAAIQCQQSFLAHRQQVDATLPASRF